ncbi:VWA domain-containing protein, partial [bacterium]
WFFWKRKIKESSILFSDISLIKEINNNRKKVDYNKVLFIIRIFVLVLLIFALARPQKGLETEEISTEGYDIVLCLDTSSSMKAEDFDPQNRLAAAKDVVTEFIKDRKHDRIGLVVFSGIAFTQCPLTVDYTALLDFLDQIEIGMTQTDGTAIGSALITCANRLKESKGKSKIVILLTDGRNNMGKIDPVTAAKACASLGVRIYTIGTAKRGPAKYPVDHPIFGKRYVTIQEDLDEDTLTKIAIESNGKYFRATNKEKLTAIYKEIDKLEKSEIKVEGYTNYKELYRYFLFPALLLFFIELILKYFVWKRIP